MNQPAGLRKDALGLVHAVAIGVAGTAPAYTIAASTAALFAATGTLAPAALLWCGLMMAGITVAFAWLNRAFPDAGASYSWVGRVLHRDLGFLCGWAVLVSSVLFMAAALIPAATATLMLVAPGMAGNQACVTAVAAAWLVAISAMEARGMRLTGTVQAWMSGIEVAVLGGLAVAAVVRHGPQLADAVSQAAFSPSAFTPGAFASGMVVAVFFYWGWDVALNASEETRDAHRTPGLAAVLAMAVVGVAFMAFAFVTLAVLGEAGAQASGANIVFAIAEKLVPQPWSYLAVLAVMLSSIGSLQVSLLQFARTLYAQSRAGELHSRWARLHPHWQTPGLATALNCALGLALLALSLALPDSNAILSASINALGLEVAFYYGLTAIACAWHFRHEAKHSAKALVFAVLWPLAGTAALWVAAALAAGAMDSLTLAIAAGSLALGLVPLARARQRRR